MKGNCSRRGCNGNIIIYLSLSEKFILFLKKAKCYRCFHFNRDLEMCSELERCVLCGSDYHVSKNDRCIKFKKSGWF